jgi:hypothetical protein
MRALTGELLLTAWDEGKDQHALIQGLILLSLALPKSDREKLEGLSLAERNLLLLRLHDLTFGPVLQGFSVCSHCSAQLEFTVPVAGLIEHVQSQLCEGPVSWEENGRHYRLRPVTSDDLLAILDLPGAREAENQLLQRCLTVFGESTGREEPTQSTEASDPTSPEALSAVLQKFEQLHAAAELSCAVHCAACSHRERLELDIAQFIWIKVRGAAKRLLAEVHELAWAYGWSEEAILHMSPHRRNAYMEILGG